jgi:hypothetical protein
MKTIRLKAPGGKQNLKMAEEDTLIYLLTIILQTGCCLANNNCITILSLIRALHPLNLQHVINHNYHKPGSLQFIENFG